MKIFKILSIILFLFLLSCVSKKQPPSTSTELIVDLENVQNQLRSRVEAISLEQGLSVGDEIIYATKVLPRFYEEREYRPAWFVKNGLIADADSLIAAIRSASLEGFRPEDYHLDLLAFYAKNLATANTGIIAEVDLLLTDAFLILGAHYLGGRINPETIDPEWSAVRREVDLTVVLKDALEKNQIHPALALLLPQHEGYNSLRCALASYQKIAIENFPIIHSNEIFKKGDSTAVVLRLRTKLKSLGDLNPGEADTPVFDDSLEQALKQFQQRHGLVADGQLTPVTVAALNVPLKQRISQLKINMERWRWLPETLGEQYIIVNIANFELDAVENNIPQLVMRVVVGKAYRKTPVFSHRMTYMVLNPFWEVPPTLAVQDILPKIKKDPAYLSKNKIQVFRGWGPASAISPDSINWRKVSEKNFGFRLRQDPGQLNALGRVKFMFPNKYNVYLHDTPSRELFKESVRTFSSGCIRIEKPKELAAWLLKDDPTWDADKLKKAFDTGKEQTVSFRNKVPVHIVYLTAFCDGKRRIHFRNDVYDRDKMLQAALAEEAPND